MLYFRYYRPIVYISSNTPVGELEPSKIERQSNWATTRLYLQRDIDNSR